MPNLARPHTPTLFLVRLWAWGPSLWSRPLSLFYVFFYRKIFFFRFSRKHTIKKGLAWYLNNCSILSWFLNNILDFYENVNNCFFITMYLICKNKKWNISHEYSMKIKFLFLKFFCCIFYIVLLHL
jgi:hypothetical protein